MLDPQLMKIIAMKESLLNELCAWLKAKGLFEEAMRDCPSSKGLFTKAPQS